MQVNGYSSLATTSEADFSVDGEELESADFDQTSEELLYSINNNLTQINANISFLVSVGFALLIVYIIMKPVFYFFR